MIPILGLQLAPHCENLLDNLVGQLVVLQQRKALPDDVAFGLHLDDVGDAPDAQLVFHSLLRVDGAIELDLGFLHLPDVFGGLFGDADHAQFFAVLLVKSILINCYQ